MKAVLPALLIVLSLAACRGDDPDDAPPVGHATAMPVATAVPDPTPSVEPHADAESAARAMLDTAWQACGDAHTAEAVRCRDEAVFAWDAAMTAIAAADTTADTSNEATTTSTTLSRGAAEAAAVPTAQAIDADAPAPVRGDLAAAQLAGTRG